MTEQETEEQFPQRKFGHYTFEDGSNKPAVTHIISKALAKPQLAYWRGSIGNSEASRIAAESKSFGSAMHKFVAEFLRSGQIPAQESLATDVKNAWSVWYNWWFDHQELDSVKSMETLLEGEDYAGTCDLLTNEAIYDWKFANGIYDSNKIQLGAYAHVASVGTGYVIRVDKKDKNMEILKMEKDELDEAYEVFRHLLAVHNWLEGGDS